MSSFGCVNWVRIHKSNKFSQGMKTMNGSPEKYPLNNNTNNVSQHDPYGVSVGNTIPLVYLHHLPPPPTDALYNPLVLIMGCSSFPQE